MAALTLEPYSTRLHWQLSPERASREWSAALGEYVQNLARRCAESGPCVVGHIKGVALFPDGGYLRVSVVSPTLVADVEGDVPEDCRELSLTLNVLVYGLPRDFVQRLAQETAADVSASGRAKVGVESLSA